MSKYIITRPDVLGGFPQGWEVNEARSTGQTVLLTEEQACTDQAVIDSLIEVEFLVAGTCAEEHVVVDGDLDMLYVSDFKTGRPMYHLQRLI